MWKGTYHQYSAQKRKTMLELLELNKQLRKLDRREQGEIRNNFAEAKSTAAAGTGSSGPFFRQPNFLQRATQL